MYSYAGYSAQGGANLARRSRQALDGDDIIGLAQVGENQMSIRASSNSAPSPRPPYLRSCSTT